MAVVRQLADLLAIKFYLIPYIFCLSRLSGKILKTFFEKVFKDF